MRGLLLAPFAAIATAHSEALLVIALAVALIALREERRCQPGR